MIGSKTVGFFALIGGVAVLVGTFIPKLASQYPFLIWAGGAISALIGLVALFSKNY
jgi:hypothetical protein